MAVQRGQKHKKLTTDTSNDSSVAIKKAKGKTKTVSTKTKTKEGKKSEVVLAEVQKALRVEQAKVEHERQARIKAEEALTEVHEALAVVRLEAAQEHQVRVRQVSFVVRLMIDEHGQFRRTEIEHVESSRKQKFLSLDGENLVIFMKACISAPNISEDSVPATLPPEKLEASALRPLRQEASLVVSDVRVYRLGDPDYTNLILPSAEPFIVQTRFQLQGLDSHFLTAQEFSYEVRVYANEVTTGKSNLLMAYNTNLIQDMFEYSVPVEVPGLSPGLYRLFTVVTIGTPIKITGYHTKAIIEAI